MEAVLIGPSARVGEGGRPRPVRLPLCFGLVAASWLILAAATPVLHRLDTRLWQAVAVVGVTVLGTLLGKVRVGLFRVLTSLQFSVALLTVILGATALGTVILQQAPAAEYARYYRSLAPVLLALGLDDLFHTSWFSGLLGLMALSLVLAVVRNRAWRPAFWGHLLSHLGVVAILAGGLAGSRFGFKGFIDLHAGEATQEARWTERGIPTTQGYPLGFTLLLEDFQVERHAPRWRFGVYAPEGGDPLRAVQAEEAQAGVSLAGPGEGFRLCRIYPDFRMESDLRIVPAGKGRPALRIGIHAGGAKGQAHLLAGVPGRDALRLPEDGGELRFVWQEPDAAGIAGRAAAGPETHTVSFQGPDGSIEEARVSPGGTYGLASGQYELRVLAYLPDFLYDMESRRPTTRSQEPNNPAIQVVVREVGTAAGEARWLFARMPGYDPQHGREASGPKLVYRYEPPRRILARELLVVGADRQVLDFVQGRLVGRTPLGAGLPASRGAITSLEVFDSAEEEYTPGTRSEAWENPVAEVEVTHGGETGRVFLPAIHGNPVRLWEGGPSLALEGQGGAPKAFRSRLAVIEGGRKVLEKTVAVNDPLTYKGTTFYQSDFRKEDPTYSGLQVVKDPGLPVVYSGLVMLAVGIVFVFYVRPRILTRGCHGT